MPESDFFNFSSDDLADGHFQKTFASTYNLQAYNKNVDPGDAIRAERFEPKVQENPHAAINFLIFCQKDRRPALRQFAVDLAIDAIGPSSPIVAASVCLEALSDRNVLVKRHTGKRIYEMITEEEGGIISDIDAYRLINVIQAYSKTRPWAEQVTSGV